MYLNRFILASIFFVGLLYAETSIGLNINDEDVEFQGELNFNELADYSSGTSYILSANYLHTNGDNMTTIGFGGENTFQGVYGLTLAFGLKAVIADDFLALPLFAKAAYELPLIDTIPTTSIITNIAYAPSVLSFSDAQKYTELRIEADMEVISNIHIFTGYRTIDTEYETYDKTFNDSFYGGLKISF